MIIILATGVFSDEPVTVALNLGGGMELMPPRPLNEVNSATLSQVINLLTEDAKRKETEHGEETEDQPG